MSNSDQFQERIGAAIGLLICGALVVIALVQTVVWAMLAIKSGSASLPPLSVVFPDALLALASGIVGFYFGAKVGTVQLNGSVAKLADGAQQMAKALQSAQPPTGIGQANPPDQAAA